MITIVMKISTIACSQAIVFLKEILINYFYVSTIHLLILVNKNKYEISPLHSASLRYSRDDV